MFAVGAEIAVLAVGIVLGGGTAGVGFGRTDVGVLGTSVAGPGALVGAAGVASLVGVERGTAVPHATETTLSPA